MATRTASSARTRRPAAAVTALAAALTLGTAAQAPGAQAAPAGGGASHWVAGWAAGQVPGSDIPGSTCPAGQGLTDETVRNVVFTSAGGEFVRVRLTNSFGTRPLTVDHATVAVQRTGADAVPGTVTTLTFGGRRTAGVPAGGQLFSDPVRLRVAALSSLLVSVHVPGATGPVTNHPFTAQTNYLGDGDHAPDTSGTAYRTTPCWMLVSGVDVRAAGRTAGTVVAFGDSITDTAVTQGDSNHRWPDFLARRLQARPGRTLSVVNAGLGGNRLIADRPGQPYYGPSGLSRMDRDLFRQTGVRSVILLEGINDIGYSASAGDIIAGYRTFVARAHAHHLRVYGATLPPFRGSVIWSADRQATWQAVNDWIRTPGHFDGVVDFAAATAVPGDPTTLNPAYDSGDHLHPNDAGTRAMANAVDLDMLLADGRRRAG